MNLPETIQDYRRSQLAFHGRVPTDVSERWVSRIIANNLHLLGEQGSEAYLARFGRNIGEDKVVHLAIKAEIEGYQDMADGFWKKAYAIQLNQSVSATRQKDNSTKKQRVIDIKRRRLKALEEQQAYHGPLTPVHIILEVEDLRRELEAYDAEDAK